MQEKVKGPDETAEASLSVTTPLTSALASPPKPATSPQPASAVAKDEDFDAYIKGLLSNNLADTKHEKEAESLQGNAEQESLDAKLSKLTVVSNLACVHFEPTKVEVYDKVCQTDKPIDDIKDKELRDVNDNR
eukprot:9678-Heterococcus_DN1.PRE.4